MGVTKDPGQLKQVLTERDTRVVGGVDVLISGKPGCGKTTALGQLALENQRLYNDVIVWRSSPDCQWSMLPDTKKTIVFWMKEGLDFTLLDRANEKVIKLEDHVHAVKTYKTAKDLVRRLDRKKINVVQTTPYTPLDPKQHIKFCWEWIAIFHELNRRIWKDTVSVFFDEFEDMVPEGAAKDFWNAELAFSGIVRALRKNDISSFLASHTLEEVHWRIKKKIRFRLYMKGSKAEGGSKIKQNLNKLNVGQAILEGDAFERFTFEQLPDEKLFRALIEVE